MLNTIISCCWWWTFEIKYKTMETNAYFCNRHNNSRMRIVKCHLHTFDTILLVLCYLFCFLFFFFCFVAGSLFYRGQFISSMKIYICFIHWENGILNIYERGRERDFHLIHFVFFKYSVRIHNLLICHRTGLSITLSIFYTLN